MEHQDGFGSGFSMEEMVVKLKKGELIYLEPLFLRFRPLVGKIQRDYKVRTMDADDYLQEARIVLYRAIELYNSEKGMGFASYYKLLLQNRIYSLIRKETAIKRTVDHRSVSYDSYEEKGGNMEKILYRIRRGEADTPEKLFEIKESSHRYVNQLSKLERKVFFYYLDGLDNQKIADLTNKTVTQVQNAYDRCRKKLISELYQNSEDSEI